MSEVQIPFVEPRPAADSALRPFVSRAHVELVGGGLRCATTPGTLLFSDISGFTALNERLVRRGREGTELMVDLLDLVFGGLLTVAEEMGGDLLEYGGDALLIRFAGEDHLGRAAVAARHMQVAFAEAQPAVRRIQRVHLGISMGLETGSVTLLSCGGDKRQLVVAGETLTSTLGAESAADAGQVVVGPVAAAQLGDVVVPGPDGWGLLDDARPVALPVNLGSGRVDVDVRGLLSAPLAEHLRTRDFAGEHRRVAALFLRFGIEPELWCGDPAGLFEILNPLATLVESACAAHGGTMINVDVAPQGGKFVVVAGAPRSFGDNVDRALAIAVDVIRDATRAGLRATLTAGVNEGVVFWGSVGSPSTRAVAVIGDTVNTAARVMAAAPPGTVLCEATAFAGARVAFDATPVEPFAAKGKSDLLHAVAVGEARAAPADAIDPSGSAAPFVGRETEVASVLACYDEVRRGGSRLVEIVGSAGIGKSRLVQHLATSLDAATPLHITGSWYGRGTAFRALAEGLAPLLPARTADALRDAVAAVAPHLLPWLPLVGLAFGIEMPPTPEVDQLEPRYRADRLRMVLVELLDTWLPRPLLVRVEDSHWLDAATVSALDRLAHARLEATMILVARRAESTGWLPDTADLAIALAPLDADAAIRLATGATGESIDPHRLSQLLERAAGHPMFLLALLEGAGGDAELPDSVEDALRVDLDQYPHATRRALGLAAVLGAEAEVSLLREVMGAEGAQLLDHVRDAPGFVVVDGPVVRFTHALRRSVAYEALPFRERRAAHSRAADALELRPEPPVELMSLHHFEAHEFSEAWQWSRAAADRARAALSPLTEIVFLERAARSAVRTRSIGRTERLSVYERWGDDLEVLGRYIDAEQIYRRGAALSENDHDRARLFGKVARQFAQTGELTRGLRWCRRAERLVEHAAPSARVDPAREHGALLFRRGDLDGALAQYRRAVAYSSRSGDQRNRAEALRQIGTILELRGQSGIRDLARAISTLERIGEHHRSASALINLGAAYYDRGEWDRAVDAYVTCARRAETIGDLVLAATAENNVSEIRSDRHELDLARTGFELALGTWRSCHYPIGVGVAQGNLGRLERRAGNLEAAADHLAAADDVFRAIAADDFVDEITVRQAELQLSRGDAAAAVELLANVRLLGDAAGPLLAARHRTAAIAALHLGQPTTFAHELDLAVGVTREHRLRYERLLIDEVRLLSTPTPSAGLCARVEAGMRRLHIADTGQRSLMPVSVRR